MVYYTSSYVNWIPPILSIAKQAAAAILKYYKSDYDIHTKLDKSPYTAADLASHTIIQSALIQEFPDIPVLSEEGVVPPFEIRSKWSRYWLVDPLDGTKEFIRQTGDFTVNIALIENHVPVLGVVFAPALNECFWAVRGKEAYMQSADKKSCVMNTTVFAPNKPLKITLSRFHPNFGSEWKDLEKRLGNYEILRRGSALKICLLAKGDADLYPCFGKTSEWDTAAGQCILEAAGGALLNKHGVPLAYNTKASLLNDVFFAMRSSELKYLCCG